MSELTLRLFGAPQLEHNGEIILLGRRKAMALLAYLAVTKSRHHREALAALLWPESDANAAYSALRNVLWILRQTPIADALQSNRSTVELLPHDGVLIDINRFRSLASLCPSRMHTIAEACPTCIPMLEEAVTLVQGHFMDGFSVVNSVRYEDWQFAEGESLRRELTEVLDRMIEYFFDIEDWNSAATYSRRWQQADPLNERSHRQLMKALAAQGRRVDALRAFEDCKRVLSTELGVSPESATLELAGEIRSTPSVQESRNRRKHRPVLPVATHPFVGRRKTVDLVEQELLVKKRQVVSLIGLGGAGKTSIALNVGRRAQEQFKDGVYYIPLDELRVDEQVRTAIARATGVTASRDEPGSMLDRLSREFLTHEALIILDAAEGALAVIRSMVEALSAAEGVQFLITSRAELQIGAETVIPVFGLPYPDPEEPGADVAGYDAVRFLRIASRRKGHEEDESEEDLAGMAQVAALVEGFPLGLEMAAGWRPLLSWSEIAARIRTNLDFLEHQRKDVAPRHRSFRAVFEQAWDLLTTDEEDVLSRLTVFSGSFSIDAAEAVTKSSPATLALLANRCLITRVGPQRYRVHELLKQFAHEHLDLDAAVVKKVERLHAAYFLSRMLGWLDRIQSTDQLAALDEMEADIGDIRRAFVHAAATGDAELLRPACETLFLYYDILTQMAAGQSLFTTAHLKYSDRDDPAPDVAGFLTIVAGWFGLYSASNEARGLIAEGMSRFEDSKHPPRLQALAYVIASYSRDSPIGYRGDRTQLLEDRRLLEASIASFDQSDHLWGVALAKGALAALIAVDDHVAGEAMAHESLHLHRSLGDRWGESITLFTLARIAEAEGDLELARSRYLQSQRLSEPISDEMIAVINSVYRRASIAARLGEYEGAEALGLQALSLSVQAEHPTLAARAKVVLAQVELAKGEGSKARQYLEEAMAQLSSNIWREEMLACALMLGNLAAEEGDRGAAEHWYREAEAIDDQSLETNQRVEHLRPSARASEGES